MVRIVCYLFLSICLLISTSSFQTAWAGEVAKNKNTKFTKNVKIAKEKKPSYKELVKEAHSLMKAGKTQDAFLVASAAVTVDDKSWEAYAIIALSIGAYGEGEDAVLYIDKAIERAPEEKKAMLASMKARIIKNVPESASVEGSKKQDELIKLVRDAEKASQRERSRLLNEFMVKSAEFIKGYPNNPKVWLMRAAVAMELDLPCDAITAANRLKTFGITKSSDPAAAKVMEELEILGWLSFKHFHDCISKAASEFGDVEAMVLLGESYWQGLNGFKKDYLQAAEWYRKAAELGDAEAQLWVAHMYISGVWGIKADEAEAAVWALKSAEKGNAVAQALIGMMYGEGRGIAKDEAKAREWTAKASKAVKTDPYLQGRVTWQKSLLDFEKKLKKESTPRQPIINKKDGYELVWIPAGGFKFGSIDGGPGTHEYMLDYGKLTGYYIGKYEVTVEKYKKFCNSTGRKMPEQPPVSRDDHPVVNVTWDDAEAYCDWAGMRLPLEAHWEKAARGGTDTIYWWGDSASEEMANYGKSDNSLIKLFTGEKGTMPVGGFAANPYGLYDTSGNVWEWCYSTYPVGYTEDNKPMFSAVLRGGSWNSDARSIRSAYREEFKPELLNMVGFRAVRYEYE